MKTLGLVIAGLAVLLLGFGIAVQMRLFDPIIGFPGGALSGAAQTVPATWDVAADIDTIQLETRPSDPYSVNVWGVGVGPNFYVATAAGGTGWSDNVDADPNVRLKIGDGLYALVAKPVDDMAEREAVLAAYVAKYDVDPESIDTNAGRVYRLTAR